jgi:hypothetical protein
VEEIHLEDERPVTDEIWDDGNLFLDVQIL